MSTAIMNAPDGSRYITVRHFTTAGEAVMQQQSTDTVRSKEELCLEVIQRGDIALNESGHVLRIQRRTRSGKLVVYPEPRRIDKPDYLGYCRFGFGSDGKRFITYAHRIVWVFHNGAIPAHLEVNHIDGDKTNNRLANLELVTRKENIRHARRTRKWKTPAPYSRNNLRPSVTIAGERCYRCTGCDEWKPQDQFGRLATKLRSVCGLLSRCRKCSSASRNLYRQRTGR